MPSSARQSAEAPLPPLIVIGGATATGKTGLSLAIAERLPGAEIISADSRQVYRGMDIGTAKVGPDKRSRVPHHGLDLVDPDEPFSVADFQRHALAALGGIAGRGGTALLVGGSGLYLRAVARGLPLSETGHDATVRARLEERLSADGLPALVDELRRRAPGMAAEVDLANPRRVVRALERVALGGDGPPPAPRGYPGRVLWLGVALDAAVHRARITERARRQFQSGFVEEAAALLERYPSTLRAFTALGYQEAFAVLGGSLPRDEAIARTAARTARFARRQRTWFRAERDIYWLDAGDERELINEAAQLVDAWRQVGRRD